MSNAFVSFWDIARSSYCWLINRFVLSIPLWKKSTFCSGDIVSILVIVFWLLLISSTV